MLVHSMDACSIAKEPLLFMLWVLIAPVHVESVHQGWSVSRCMHMERCATGLASCLSIAMVDTVIASLTTHRLACANVNVNVNDYAWAQHMSGFSSQTHHPFFLQLHAATLRLHEL